MRIFAFGCSLTQYFYPTWADIVLAHYQELGYETFNWGKSGAGNQYIFTKIFEANTLHKFTSDDIVLVQWTSMFREDRYHEDNGWYCPGGFDMARLKTSKFSLNNFDYEDELQWADFLHCTMRDCAMISSARLALQATGCKVLFTGFRKFTETYEVYDEFKENTLLTIDNLGKILSVYENNIKLDVEPILNALNFSTTDEFFASRPKSIPDVGEKYNSHLLPETHPLPNEHKKYVEQHVLPYLGVDHLNDKAIQLVDKYMHILQDQNPIVLSKIGWVNRNQQGFSDDGWRP